MNAAWLLPAAAGAALTFLGVTTSRPPSPPSRSAALEGAQEERGFMVTLKTLVCNRPYLVLVFVVGWCQFLLTYKGAHMKSYLLILKILGLFGM